MIVYLLSLAVFNFHSQLVDAIGPKANKLWAFKVDCSYIPHYVAQPANSAKINYC